MPKADSKRRIRIDVFGAKGVTPSRLRQRRHVLSRKFGLPDDLLGGSLVLGHRCCGKPGCWCGDEGGHPQWTLTYSVEGRKRGENVPADLVDQLMPLVEKGQAWRDAVAEIRSINAQLLHLWRVQQRAKKARGSVKRARLS